MHKRNDLQTIHHTTVGVSFTTERMRGMMYLMVNDMRKTEILKQAKVIAVISYENMGNKFTHFSFLFNKLMISKSLEFKTMPHARGCMHFRRGPLQHDPSMGHSHDQKTSDQQPSPVLGGQSEVDPNQSMDVGH